MNNNKNGFVSIEVVVVLAIILLGGTIGINKYSAKGKETTNKSTATVQKYLNNAGDKQWL